MPNYDFKCPDCGQVFERMQKMSDPNPDHCPLCDFNGSGFVKVIKSANQTMILKGGNWTSSDKSSWTKRRNS